MRRERHGRSRLRNVAMVIAGAIAAPIAWLAGHVLTHPVLPHAIAAPRRVLSSTTLGRISYYEDDGASGLPVVLLHDVGTLGSTYELRGLFDAIRADRPVLAPDLPGYGFSERRRAAYTREEYVRFVQDVISDVSRRYGATVDIVAVGTTGELAARAVTHSSRHVRSLCLISPTGFAVETRIARRLRRALDGSMLGVVARHVSASRPALRMTMSKRSAGAHDEALVRYVNAAANQPRAGSAIVTALSGALSDPRVVEDVYDAVRVPVCFLHGGEDSAVPRRGIDLLAAGHGSFRRSEIAGARAMPHVERTFETAEALRAFWRTLAVKPDLRVIRGERTSRTLEILRRGTTSGAARRRPWT